MNVEQKAKELMESECAVDPKRNGAAAELIYSAALRAIARALEQPEGREAVDVTGFGAPPLFHEERKDAEQAYTVTAFDYQKAPVGSRDWALYWRGWWHRSLVYGDTTPPAKVPEVEGRVGGADSGSVKQIVPLPKRYPKPDENGNDTGPCCAHAYADGWNECRAAMLAAAQQPKEGA